MLRVKVRAEGEGGKEDRELGLGFQMCLKSKTYK
jgi:hypothetical protein